MQAKKKRLPRSAKRSVQYGDSAILRLAIGAVLLGMTWASVPLAKAITTSLTVTASPFTVAVTSPASGAALSGTVALEARVSAAAGSGIFRLSGGSVAVQMPVQGTQDLVDPLKWTAKLDSSSLSAGAYALTFSAVRSFDKATATSAQVDLTVNASASSITTPPSPYYVAFLAPASGSAVSGDVTLSAGVNRAADYLTFVVTPSVGGGLVELRAAMDSTSAWNGIWNTADFPNGTYTVVAHAFHAAVMDLSDPLTLVVRNAVPPPTFAISVQSPTSGAALTGMMTLSSSTNVAATGLTYTIVDGNGTPVASVNATPSNGGRQWTAAWDTATLSDGSYSLHAKSIRAGALAESAAVPFTVANATGANVLTVRMTSPSKGTVVSGTAELYAQTSPFAGGLTFVIAQDFGSRRSMKIVAAGGPTSWYAPWDSAGWESGSYLVHAMALNGAVTSQSGDVSFSVTAPLTAAPAGVRVTVPSAGASIAGQVSFAARTDASADLAIFELRNPASSDTSPVATVAANGADVGTSWTATLNTTSIPDGEYMVAAVVMRDGVRATSTSVPVHVQNLNGGQAAVPSFEIRSPALEASVSGFVPLEAVASSAIDGLTFIVEGPNVPGGRMALPAASNADRTAWTVSWNTGAVADGSATLVAVASKSGHELEGAPRSVVIANAAKPAVTVVPKTTVSAATATSFRVSVLSPVTGASVGGELPLVASAEGGTALAVRFVIGPATGGATANIDARYDNVSRRWLATWHPDAVASGAFVVTVTAQNAHGEIAQSDRVRVTVGAGGPMPGSVAVSATESGATSSPSTALKLPLAVKLLTPSADYELRGPVILSAEASGASTVSFAILSGGGANVLLRQAANDGTGWFAYADTTALPDGRYDVEVSATDEAGSRVVAPRVAVRVHNAGSTSEITKVDVVPVAAVIAAVRERPSDVTPLFPDALPPSIADTSVALTAECVARKVPVERCDAWLALSAAPSECAAAGIVTKEECVAFLKATHGGAIAACDGKSEAECGVAVAKVISGLMSNADMRTLRETVISQIGHAVEFPARGTSAGPTAGGILPAPPVMLEHSPFSNDKPLTVIVHASPGFAASVGNVSHQAVPAVLMIDSDNDGLPDDVEARIGTDPHNPDTDGDGYGDGLEVERGYNPLGPGLLAGNVALASVDVAVISGVPLEQPKDAGVVVPELRVEVAAAKSEKSGTFTIAGRAKPNAVVTVFVYSSLPLVFTTVAKDDGTWSYDIGSGLADGQHEAYATVVDGTGKIVAKSDPLSFFVSEAKAVTQSDFFSPTPMSPLVAAVAEDPSRMFFGRYVGAVALLVAIALVVAYLLFVRSRKILPPPQG